MESRTRRNYSAAFKREAVELAREPGQAISGVAADLNIGAGLIQRWKRELSQHGCQAFVGQGVVRAEDMLALRRSAHRRRRSSGMGAAAPLRRVARARGQYGGGGRAPRWTRCPP